jgi:hypothetical protein
MESMKFLGKKRIQLFSLALLAFNPEALRQIWINAQLLSFHRRHPCQLRAVVGWVHRHCRRFPNELHPGKSGPCSDNEVFGQHLTFVYICILLCYSGDKEPTASLRCHSIIDTVGDLAQRKKQTSSDWKIWKQMLMMLGLRAYFKRKSAWMQEFDIVWCCLRTFCSVSTKWWLEKPSWSQIADAVVLHFFYALKLPGSFPSWISKFDSICTRSFMTSSW